MRIQAQRLKAALELLSNVSVKKATLPALNCIAVEDGRLRCTNLEADVSIGMPESRGMSLLLPRARVQETLRHVPPFEMVTVAGESPTVVSLMAGNLKLRLGTIPFEEYPPTPEAKDLREFTLSGSHLVNALVDLAPFTAKDDSRPVLACVAVFLDEKIACVAADGFRLAFLDVPGIPLETLKKLEGLPKYILVPRHLALLLAKVWGKTPPAPALDAATLADAITTPKRLLVGLNEKGSQGFFSFNGVRVALALTTGTYPNVQQLVPATWKSRITFLGYDLARALGQVGHVAGDSSNIVRLGWDKTTLTVSARDEGDVAVATVPLIKHEGEDAGKIAFNLSYLTDYLDDKQMEVTLATTSPSHPAVLSYVGSPNHVLMPMFVQWDEKTKDSQPENKKPEGEPESAAEGTGPEPPEEEEPSQQQARDEAGGEDPCTEGPDTPEEMEQDDSRPSA